MKLIIMYCPMLVDIMKLYRQRIEEVSDEPVNNIDVRRSFNIDLLSYLEDETDISDFPSDDRLWFIDKFYKLLMEWYNVNLLYVDNVEVMTNQGCVLIGIED